MDTGLPGAAGGPPDPAAPPQLAAVPNPMLGAMPAGLTSAEQAHATLQSLAALSQVTGPPPSAVPADGAVANLAPFSQLAAGAMHMPLASVPLGALGAPTPAPELVPPDGRADGAVSPGPGQTRADEFSDISGMRRHGKIRV